MKIIFLEFHGVLFLPACYVTARLMNEPPKAHPPCIEALNRITSLSGAKIVATSNWRSNGMGLVGYRLQKWGATGTVVDVTPAAGRTRREDIEAWFRLCEQSGSYEAGMIGRSGVESFVVIDSEPDFGWMSEMLVRTDPDSGLTNEKADLALHLLEKRVHIPVGVKFSEIGMPMITKTTPR